MVCERDREDRRRRSLSVFVGFSLPGSLQLVPMTRIEKFVTNRDCYKYHGGYR